MSSKTPVSMLQEMAVKYRFTPIYELVQQKCGTHINEFTMKVSGFNKICYGKGSSKKEAKQNSAQALLDLLNNVSETNNSHSQKALEEYSLMSPYCPENYNLPDYCPENLNYVGKLQENCSVHSLSSPVYINVGECGLPHLKQFTVKCRVGQMEREATGVTKKRAKQLAAQKVLSMLNEENDFRTVIPTIKYLTLDSEDLNRKALIALSRTRSRVHNNVTGIASLVNSFKNTFIPNLISNVDTDLYLEEERIGNLVSLCKSMCKKFNITISEKEVPSVKDICIIYVDFKTNEQDKDNFHWGFIGLGEDLKSCRLNAYKHWIKFIKSVSL